MLTALGHVNNVMYNKYVETARVRFVKHHAEEAATAEQRRQWDDLTTPRSLGLILKRITTEFKLVCDNRECYVACRLMSLTGTAAHVSGSHHRPLQTI